MLKSKTIAKVLEQANTDGVTCSLYVFASHVAPYIAACTLTPYLCCSCSSFARVVLHLLVLLFIHPCSSSLTLVVFHPLFFPLPVTRMILPLP